MGSGIRTDGTAAGVTFPLRPLTAAPVQPAIESPAVSAEPAATVLPVRERYYTSYRVREVSEEHWRRKAGMLIKRMFSWRGYETAVVCMLPNRPTWITLETSQGEHIFGTLSLGFDSKEGLLADSLFHTEVNALRTVGHKLCQVSNLALDPEHSSSQMLASLLHRAYDHARIIHKVTDVLIEVHPRHAKFYQRMLGFRQVAQVRTCPRVNAPAVLLHLELAYLESRIAKYASYRITGASLFLRQLQRSGAGS